MKSNDINIDSEDLRKLKGIAYHPSLAMISPFIPFLVYLDMPISAIFLVLPIVDFFSFPVKVSRKYIVGYEKWYLIIFSCSLVCRIILEFVSIVFWLVPIVLVPFVLVIWGGFVWRNWWKLYNSAQ